MSFTTSAQAQRVSKQTSTQTKQFLYDFQRLLRESDRGTGGLLHE